MPPRPVSVHKEPLWTGYGVLESYEPGDDDGDPYEDGPPDLLNKNELVAALLDGSRVHGGAAPGQGKQRGRGPETAPSGA